MFKPRGAVYDRAGWVLHLMTACLLALALATASGRLDVRAGEAQGLSAGTSTVEGGLDLSISGQVGGSSEALAADGHFVYVGVGARLVIFDVSTPTSPKVVGRSPILSATVRAIQLKDGLAYVAVGYMGLEVLDVSVPASIKQVGSLDIEGLAMDVVLQGEQVLVLRREELQAPVTTSLLVLDVAMPTAPRVIGTLDLPGGGSKVETLGSLAIIANGPDNGLDEKFRGLTDVDASIPTAPRIVGGITLPGVLELRLVGHIAYTVGNSFRVIDLSAPGAPTEVGSLDLPTTAHDVDVHDGLAFLAGDNDNLLVVDVSAPDRPHLLGSFVVGRGVRCIEHAGSVAYLIGYDGLQVFDVVAPGAPRLLATINVSGQAYDVQVVDKWAYVADGRGILVYDVSEADDPRLVGRVDTGSSHIVRVIGHLAFVGGLDSSMRVVDVSLPSDPRVVAEVEGHDDMVWDIAVADGRAYVAWGHWGLKVVDVSTSSASRIIGGIDKTGVTFGVDVSGNHAYLATGGGLEVVDVSDPRSPRLVVSTDPVPDLTVATAVRVHGTTAYVYRPSIGLMVVDVTLPSAPRLEGALDVPWYHAIGGIDVVGNFVYLVEMDVGLHVIDATSPSAPRTVGSLPSVRGMNLDVTDDRIYVAGERAGLLVYQAVRRPADANHIAWLPYLVEAHSLR